MWTKIKEMFHDLKSFSWNLFIALCLLALAPAIYETIRTLLVSSTISTEAIDIIGEMEWFDLINETLIAFLIIPLYSIFNKIYHHDKEHFAQFVFKIGLLVWGIYSIFQIIVLIYGHSLVSFMNPEEIDIEIVTNYLRIETTAFMIGIIASFVNVVFVVVGKSRNMYIFLVLSSALMTIGDFALVPNFGVYGVAYSNILTNSIMAIAGIFVLYFEKLINFSKFHKDDLPLLKTWAQTGLFSGGQSFLDNTVYMLMIVKMINMVSEQGNYWVANNFIWGWLLIPITALSEIIKRDCKDGYFNMKHENYYLITIFVILLWGVTIPLWPLFFKHVEQLKNYEEIFSITLKLVPFYIAFAIGSIHNNTFIGLGKTYYNAISSFIINVVYYGLFFIFYITGILKMNIDVIILMFGFGMVTHMIISFIEEAIMKKKLLKEEDSCIKENL